MNRHGLLMPYYYESVLRARVVVMHSSSLSCTIKRNASTKAAWFSMTR